MTATYKATVLYKEYCDWCDRCGLCTNKISGTALGLKLKDVDGVEKNRNKGGMMYEVDWAVVMKWLQDNNSYDEDAF